MTRLGFDCSLVAWVSRVSRKRRYDSHPARRGYSASISSGAVPEQHRVVAGRPNRGMPALLGTSSIFVSVVEGMGLGLRTMKQIRENRGVRVFQLLKIKKERTS